MRKYESIILEAELMALPAELVRERLIDFAVNSKQYDSNEKFDEEVEDALRLRRDPLIDLSLSQYGRYIDVSKLIFNNSPPGSAVRVAALANRNFSKAFLSHFPSGLFNELEDQIQWFMRGEDVELAALFQNPTISDRFLRSVLEQENEFARVPDERFRYIVSILAYNPRMETRHGSIYIDGQSEYDYNSVFYAAWMLAEKVEPTAEWAMALSALYTKLLPKCYSMKAPLEVAQRWRTNPSQAKPAEDGEPDAGDGYLSGFESVRMSLARLAAQNNDKLLTELLTHEDRAFRAAAYVECELTQEQMTSAQIKDGELAFQYAIKNKYLWRVAERRKMLEAMAWATSIGERGGYMDASNQFRHTEQHMIKLHPDWFKDEPAAQREEEEMDTDKEPATRADLAQAFALLQNEMEKNKPGKTLDWIFWITIFTAVYVFFKLS